MISRKLLTARAYEENAEQLILEEERPAFHLSPRTGWMNDPNGFSRYGGLYHMFYQYYPYEARWGLMHWGHAVSEDLLHWTYLPVALAADSEFDKDGCFSGSAATLPDGRQLLMYTGVVLEIQSDGSTKEIQQQCLAVGDGTEYVKYEGNPVLTERDLPEGSDRFDFRDPKIWKRPDGTWRCIVGNRHQKDSSRILMFESEDGFHWKWKKVLADNRFRFGRMWECPDFFELDGKWVLLTSPQDMLPQGFEYHNGNGTLCLIGSFDEETETFVEESNQAVDYGIDFYAMQTLLTEDGRRVMIGWMQNWDTCTPNTAQRKWFGQMSLPRELSIKNGRLCQAPIRELQTLRKNEVRHEDVRVSGRVELDGVSGRKAELILELQVQDPEVFRKFTVCFAENEHFHTNLSYRPHEGTLKIDRKFSGSRRAVIHQRRTKVYPENGILKLHLILDRFSAEVFVNDGQQTMTCTLYTDLSAEGISFSCDGGEARISVTKWELS